MKWKKNMFIAIDIGNTDTVIGICSGNTLATELRIPSTSQEAEEKIIKRALDLFTNKGIDSKDIDGVGISSVVPEITVAYISLSKKYFHKEPLIVGANLDLGIKIHYDNPESLGTDRLCTAVAGYAKYGGPLIIIDFGTATTYGVIASNGDFLGGVIAAGIATSAAALHQRTARLPDIDLHIPENIIGINTAGSMQSGILWGAIDAMTGMVERLQSDIQKCESKKAAVIATGGFSQFIAEHSQIIQHVERYLVLDGIRLIYDRVHR
jgi:type III pantothenate kinase